MTQITNRLTTVTPRKAQKYLERNHCNRSVSPSQVRLYANEMKAGRWRIDGHPIVFDTEGVMRDGQHRCYACIEADTPFQTFVLRGADPNVMESLDTQKPRSVANYLQFLGKKDTFLLAGIANVCHTMFSWQPPRSKAYKLRATQPLKSRAYMAQYLKEHPLIEEAAIFARENRETAVGIISPSLVGASAVVFSEVVSKNRGFEFATHLATGADLPRTSPIFKLRARFQRVAVTPGLHMRQDARISLIIRCWNFWVTGSAMQKLAIRTTAPKLYILGPKSKLNQMYPPSPKKTVDKNGEDE